MIAVDTNILVYAHRGEMPFSGAARACIAELAAGNGEWAIPWPCIHEFLAAVTSRRGFKTPTPLRQACDKVDAWLESPAVALLAETDTHWTRLAAQLALSRVVGGTVHDARIAAICLDHGVTELWSADRDFSRFPDLKTVNPLIGRT